MHLIAGTCRTNRFSQQRTRSNSASGTCMPAQLVYVQTVWELDRKAVLVNGDFLHICRNAKEALLRFPFNRQRERSPNEGGFIRIASYMRDT